MSKKFLSIAFLLLFGIFLSGCSLKKSPAALQINSTPEANIFIDGKQMEKTPFSSDSLTAGEVNVRLIPETTTETLSSWEGKVKLNEGVLTLIERNFSSSEADSSTLILTLEKIKEKTVALISVISDPDGAYVSVDGENKGVTPLDLDKISEGDHEIVIYKEGYREKIKPVKNIAGYKLIVNVKLGLAEITPTLTPTPSGPTPKATVTPKLGAKITVSPVPTKGVGTSSGTAFVLVKENSLGFLRVRNAPLGTEIAQIKPIDTEKRYPLLEESKGWYKIIYEEGKEGWVTADTTYTTKITE